MCIIVLYTSKRTPHATIVACELLLVLAVSLLSLDWTGWSLPSQSSLIQAETFVLDLAVWQLEDQR